MGTVDWQWFRNFLQPADIINEMHLRCDLQISRRDATQVRVTDFAPGDFSHREIEQYEISIDTVDIRSTLIATICKSEWLIN